MKKNMRKILSLVLAMVMILSFSVTAFAADAETNTATVTIKVNGAVVATNPNVAPGQSVYAYLGEKYGATGEDYWYSFNDANNNPAYALKKLTVNEVDYESGAADGTNSGIAGVQWSSTRKGYGFEGFAYNDDDEVVGYNYIYVGNDFVYTVTNGSNNVDVSDKYMNQYTIQAGDVVTISFDLVISRWTATTPFETTEPYI